MAAPKFCVYATDLVTGDRRGEIPFTSYEWTEAINRPGSLRGSLPAFHDASTLLAPGATALWVDQEGQIRWGGILWETSFDLDRQQTWDAAAEGFMSYYMDGGSGPRRTIRSRQGMTYAIATGAVNGQAVEVTFPNAAQGTPVDEFDVVADLMAHAATIAAGANVGFDDVRMHGPGAATAHPSASGTLSGVTWERTYWSSERQGIGKALADIAQAYPGFEWQVLYDWDSSTSPWTPRRYLDLYYPRLGQDHANIVLEHGGSVWLVRGDTNGGGLANRLTGIGAGSGAEALLADIEDASARYPATDYPYLEGRYDAYEEAVQANLDARTRSRLARTRLPVDTFTVSVWPGAGIDIGDVNLGDTVRLIIDPPATSYAVDGWFRIVQQSVKVGTEGVSEWKLSLASDDASLGVF